MLAPVVVPCPLGLLRGSGLSATWRPQTFRQKPRNLPEAARNPTQQPLHGNSTNPLEPESCSKASSGDHSFSCLGSFSFTGPHNSRAPCFRTHKKKETKAHVAFQKLFGTLAHKNSMPLQSTPGFFMRKTCTFWLWGVGEKLGRSWACLWA